MEVIRELLPFILGIVVVPPIYILLFPKSWSNRVKFVVIFVLCVVVGFIGSTMVGEQIGELEKRVITLIFDTSTVYTGSQIAYWFFWKSVLENRLQKTPT
ncbi:MAG: hypothetical protein GC179_05545 [Anaerolineaceae bacterium]|nr:hypothetical protein [Anaerolineaceae bacterium]